jgi:hypothetical protein
MKGEVKLTKEYMGHKITIGEEHAGTRPMLFRVTGPTLDDGWFDSYAQATAKIEATVHADDVQKRRRIALQVLNEEGDPVTVTGVHAGRGSVLGVKGDFYPDVPWLAALLQRCAKLNQELSTLKAQARPFRMDASGWGLKEKLHGAKVDELIALIEATTEKAKAAAPKLVPVKAAE